jgi:hypothetical protein
MPPQRHTLANRRECQQAAGEPSEGTPECLLEALEYHMEEEA